MGEVESSTTESPYPPNSRAWFVVGTLTIAWVLAYLDRTIITLLTPALKVDLNLSDTRVSIVQGLAFSLFFALAGLPLGRLVDRGNRRNIIIAGVLCWSVMTLCCGLATTYWQLLAARVGVGIGEACLAPASFSILADYLAPARRGKAIGIVSSGYAVGTAGSNILGGLLLKMIGHRSEVWVPLLGNIAPWRFVFLVFAVPGILIALLMLLVKEPLRRGTAAQRSESFTPYLLANAPVFLCIYAACALAAIVALGFTLWGPVALMRVHGMSVGDAGLVLGSIQLVTGFIAGFTGGYVSDLMMNRNPLDGRLRVLALIAPLMAVSVLLFCLPVGLTASLIGYGGIKMGFTMMYAAAYVAVQELAPSTMRGQAIAVLVLVVNLVGMGAGPTVIAMVTDYGFRDESKIMGSILVVCLTSTLLCWVFATLAVRPSRRLRQTMLTSATT
jgi:MFS family permease